jgi:hypothetical protein
MEKYHLDFNLQPIVYQNELGLDCLEQWKNIPDYEGLYQVSDLGRVKSLERRVFTLNKNCIYKPIIIKSFVTKRGYFEVRLCTNNTSKAKKIHRLLAESFIPNPNQKHQVNHIDGNKLNNNILNLEWVNNRENSCHRVKNSNLTSRYVGVSYFKRDDKWRSSIQVNGKSIRFGMFNTEEEAYQKRVDFEKENGIVNKYL